ncbi:MAG: hypothetical protein ABI972_27955 [Acidobacteriota bacterium]
MPSFDAIRTLPSFRRQFGPAAPVAPAKLSGALDPGELQIKILIPNDPTAQALATSIFQAIKQAHRTWQSTAVLTGVMVNAVTAVGGIVVGPPLTPLIIANIQGKNSAEQKLVKAIATVVGTSWLTYTSTIRVPGLPWYPAFAAVPGPVAPPTPNIPSPLLTLTQIAAPLNSPVMKAQIIGQLAGDRSREKIIDAVLVAFAQFFSIWQVTTMVTNVLGTGPVPSFAPPFVPVGPVVAGVGTMIPGGFI